MLPKFQLGWPPIMFVTAKSFSTCFGSRWSAKVRVPSPVVVEFAKRCQTPASLGKPLSTAYRRKAQVAPRVSISSLTLIGEWFAGSLRYRKKFTKLDASSETHAAKCGQV